MIKLTLPALLLALSCAPAAAGDLDAEVKRILAQAPQATIGVRVEAARGAALVALNDATPLVPASNMKLLTSAAALHELGPEFALTTKLIWTGQDLWIVGAGDPTISLRFDASPLLDALARAVKAQKITAVRALVHDARVFDDVRLHPRWEDSDAERWYGAEVAGLSLNDNCIDVQVAGGATPRAVTKPDTRYVQIQVEAKTTDNRKRSRWGVVRDPKDRRRWRLTGRVYRGAKPGYAASVPVTNPPAYFATVLQERLQAHGITVGAVRAASTPQPTGTTVWSRTTKLGTLLPVVNQNSQNLYAECLLKLIGRGHKRLRPGTWKRGARAVRLIADRVLKLPAGHVVVSDGSGLSRGNRLTARAVVRLIKATLAGPHGERYLNSLAGPGLPGTLKRRLRNLPKGVSLRAKTGTLTRVAAVSGVLTGPNDRRWVFSLLANGKGARHRLLDQVIQALAKRLKGA